MVCKIHLIKCYVNHVVLSLEWTKLLTDQNPTQSGFICNILSVILASHYIHTVSVIIPKMQSSLWEEVMEVGVGTEKEEEEVN